MICATIASNDSALLKKSLTAYSQISSDEVVFCVIDTLETHAQNAKTISKTKARVTHVEENAFRQSIPERFSFAFAGKHGGIRNIGLALAFKQKAHCVFLDDDTMPANDVFSVYSQTFAKNKQIVCGKYLKHAGGTSSLLIAIMHSLDELQQNRISALEATELLDAFFRGIPPETTTPLQNAGIVGGNLGVSLETLSRYCFFPTAYRVEDGTYAVLAPHYKQTVFNPIESPLVSHDKQPGGLTQLHSDLLSETKGSIISLLIQQKLENNVAVIAEKLSQTADIVFKNSLLQNLQEKERLNNFVKLASRLEPEIGKEYTRLLSITPAQMTPSLEEAQREIDLFFKTQEKWPEILGAL